MLLLCVGCVCEPLINERDDNGDDDDDVLVFLLRFNACTFTACSLASSHRESVLVISTSCSGCVARPVTKSIVTRRSLCVHGAAATNHITAGDEGGRQAGQCVWMLTGENVAGVNVEVTTLMLFAAASASCMAAEPSLGSESAGTTRPSSSSVVGSVTGCQLLVVLVVVVVVSVTASSRV